MEKQTVTHKSCRRPEIFFSHVGNLAAKQHRDVLSMEGDKMITADIPPATMRLTCSCGLVDMLFNECL